MKKTRLIPLIFAAAALAFSVTACHDNIYYLIQQEVEQENGLEGDILNIVPFKGNLYISNSLIYKKPLASSGTTGKYNYQWEKVSAKCSGKDLTHIITLAADDNYLYCRCENCAALAEQYGGQSGIMIWFVNQIAADIGRDYPDL
ncbi:MAG: DUF4838 domain-containing protein, partial [Treponema sp.]|nr:DUF4838 domain-containing protein [Treponema sp.]